MLLQELFQVLKNWRLIHLLGISNLRVRYARSKIGQSWLTVSLFIQIVSTGLVWSVLWHMPVRTFLPYLAVSQTIYQFFLSVLQDSTNLFVMDSRLYINQRLPFLTSVLANFYKNVVIFLHNAPIIVFALYLSGSSSMISWIWLAMLPFVCVFLVGMSYVMASICARYRDMTHIITSLLQISFLVTPVLWQIQNIPQRFQAYFFLNPLTCFLELLRNPLMGLPINDWAYVSLLGWFSLTLIMLWYMHHRFEKRIIFWI